MSSQPSHVMVIDPLNFGGLLKVPLAKTFDTKGRNDWLKGILKKDLSLCCLFQRAKCHAGSKCHQVHADRNFVADLRSQCSKITSCCLRCGDTASSYPAGKAMFTDLRNAGCYSLNLQGAAYPMEFLAYTVGLAGYLASAARPQVFMSGDALLIPATRVCRLHLRGGCKYGKDCKNVHLCSQLGEAVLRGGPAQGPSQRSHAPHPWESDCSNDRHEPARVNAPRGVPSAPKSSYALPPYVPHTPSPPPQLMPFREPPLVAMPASVEASFNQESLNTPVVQSLNDSRSRHSFGDELNDEDSIGPAPEELSFELKIVSEKKSNFLFRWSHPANASPVPTCLASSSLRQLVSS